MERSDWPYPFWIAHRGAGRLAPENTLAAFRTGAGHGYRMFECDVKLSGDGVPFLLHDATLDRTTNAPATPAAGGGTVAGEQPWSALSQLDAGSWHSRAYAGETLPTLAAVSRWCRANGHNLNIEIKPTPGTAHPTGVAVAQAASTLWAGASTPPLLTSFQTDALAGALEAAPELPRGLLLDHLRTDWLDVAASLRCQAVVCHHALWEASTVALARDHGLRCLSYTVNDDGEAQRLIALGTDGIITDRVDLFSPAG